MSNVRSLLAILPWLLILSVPQIASAQALGIVSTGDEPLEVEASGGIELHQDQKVVVARGDAIAKQGDVTLSADVLAASYRENAEGKREIYRLDALGNLRIQTAKETIHGETAVYDLDQDLVQITGKNLRIVAPDQTITARDSLEYWNGDQRAVARGNAVASRADQRVRADILEALLEETEGEADKSKPRIRKIRAWGNVHISTKSDIARGERGEYDVVKELATLSGNVRITRGGNQLNGDRAEVNMRTGLSRLVTDTAGASSGRVRGVFFPKSKDADTLRR